MSKELNALVLIEQARHVSSLASHGSRSDSADMVQYIRSGAKCWADGRAINEYEIGTILAGEIFLALGHIATCRFIGQKDTIQKNSFKSNALRTIDEVSPFRNGDTLPAELLPLPPFQSRKEGELPEVFSALLAVRPQIESELKEKLDISQNILRERGTVTLQAYSRPELIANIDAVQTETIAPDYVTFDDQGTAAVESHNALDLMQRAGMRPQSIEISYYQTFGNNPEANVEMMSHALEDMQALGRAIK